MVNLQNIHSLTEFKRNANSYIETVRTTKAPIVLTVNGEAAVVLQDAIAFQALLDRLKIAQEEINELKLVALRRDLQVGIDQLKNGQYTDYTEETLDELFENICREGRAELGIAA